MDHVVSYIHTWTLGQAEPQITCTCTCGARASQVLATAAQTILNLDHVGDGPGVRALVVSVRPDGREEPVGYPRSVARAAMQAWQRAGTGRRMFLARTLCG